MQQTQAKQIQGITEEDLEELATLFHVLGDVTRLKILYLCCQQKDLLNQQEIGEYIEKWQSTFVHHITILRSERILQRRKKGLNCYHVPRKYPLKRMIEFLTLCLEMEEKR